LAFGDALMVRAAHKVVGFGDKSWGFLKLTRAVGVVLIIPGL